MRLPRKKAAIVISAIDTWVETNVISGEEGQQLSASVPNWSGSLRK